MNSFPDPRPVHRSLGIVIIGRNEGDRLVRCLSSSTAVPGAVVVYVDSNSSDDSVQVATRAGTEVVQLDLTVPFTAARARNVGFHALVGKAPGISHVAFIDGDCEWFPGWLESAIDFLRQRPDVVAVCGRRRERAPLRSVFNRMCDIEWDTPVGEARSVGGDALFKAEAFRSSGGYRDDLIAGEEPELCVRLREAGGHIWRLDEDMTWHDAAMTRFKQWWQRTVRSGHAFAEGASIHGNSPERHFVVETRRALWWGAVLPACIVVASFYSAWSLAALLAYPAQWLRIGRHAARSGKPVPYLYAAFLLLGRLPEAQGALKFWLSRKLGHRSAIIEYK